MNSGRPPSPGAVDGSNVASIDGKLGSVPRPSVGREVRDCAADDHAAERLPFDGGGYVRGVVSITDVVTLAAVLAEPVEVLLRHLVVAPAERDVDRGARDVEDVDACRETLVAEEAASRRQIDVDAIGLLRIDERRSDRASGEADAGGEPGAAAEVPQVHVEAIPREAGVAVVVPIQHALGQRSCRRCDGFRFLITRRRQGLRPARFVLRLRRRRRSDRQHEDDGDDAFEMSSCHAPRPLQGCCRVATRLDWARLRLNRRFVHVAHARSTRCASCVFPNTLREVRGPLHVA